jgi:ankyrin repeat protein
MGADINTTDRNHRSMLHWASRYGNAKLTDALLKMDIKYNVTDIEQKDPMDLAVLNKQEDVIEVLGKHIYERQEEAKRKYKILEEKKKREEKEAAY